MLATRLPSVEIYDSATGSTPLKWRGGGRQYISNLTFSTGLPGGFLDCSFTLSGASGRLWGVDTGQRVVVRWGTKIVYYGWIEDVERIVRGSIQAINVTCFGPWQNCQQRTIESYNPSGTTDSVIKAIITTYCEQISSHFDHVQATSVTADNELREYITVADIIQEYCTIGNSANQSMLFAIWEPYPGWLEAAVRTNLAINPGFETGSGTDATGWTQLTVPGGTAQRSTTLVRSGTYSASRSSGTGAAMGVYTHGSTDTIAVTASTDYAFRVFHATTASSYPADADRGLWCCGIKWYTAGSVLISEDLWVCSTDYALSSTDWRQVLRVVTAPATATQARLFFTVRGWNGDPAEWRYTGAIDDVAFYAILETGTLAKPLVYFWARDLTDFDYYLYTASLPEGIGLNESTRVLMNSVVTQYKDGYTPIAQNAASIAKYRQRDGVVDGGAVDLIMAVKARDIHLARYKDPVVDIAGMIPAAWGTVLSKHGRPVDAMFLRAGDRLKMMDGPNAGTVIHVTKTTYANGIVTLTPEQDAEIAAILAKGI